MWVSHIRPTRMYLRKATLILCINALLMCMYMLTLSERLWCTIS